MENVTVSQGKRFFENIANGNSTPATQTPCLTKSLSASQQLLPVVVSPKPKSSVSKSFSSTQPRLQPPPKPKRTFAQDRYFSSQTLLPVKPAPVAVQTKIVKPKPAPRRNLVTKSKTVQELMAKFSNDVNINDQRKSAGIVEDNKINQKFTPLKKQPKYFQLSHDYEEIFSVEKGKPVTVRRFGSAHNLNIVEEHYDEIVKEEKLHYDSASLIDVENLKPKPKTLQLNKNVAPKNEAVNKASTITFTDHNKLSPTDENPLKVLSEDECDSDDNDNSEIDKRISRAKSIRQKNIIHYDHQEVSFLKRKAPHLFELAVLIELSNNDNKNPKYLQKFMPTYRLIYPCDLLESSDSILDTLLCLSYPNINTINSLDSLTNGQRREHDESFVITLTDTNGDRKFAYYRRFIRRTDPHRIVPTAFCIVSPVQAGQFYRDLVKEAVNRLKIGGVQALSDFLKFFFYKPLPPPNCSLSVAGNSQWSRILLINRHSLTEIASDLHMILNRFGVDDTLKLFASLLTERRIILIGGDVTVLSRIVQATVRLLTPFSWPHSLIPVVPDSLLEMTELPSPYLMGVLRSSLPSVLFLFCDKFKLASTQDDEEYLFIYDVDHGVLKDGKNDNSNDETYRLFKASPVQRLREKLTVLENGLTSPSFDDYDDSTSLTNEVDFKMSHAFLTFFAEILHNYKQFISLQKNGLKIFRKMNFVKSASSRKRRRFLRYFVDTGMFQVWINRKLEDKRFLGEAIDQYFDQVITDLQQSNNNKRRVFNKFSKRF